jgi:uncharacterized protein YndB with AHSA1/START domain
MNLPHRLERTVSIQAARETVFRFFTDNERWASWWGAGSTIDARPGGKVLIRYPNGVEVSGETVEVKVPERIVFTYGYVSGDPIPPGSSRVTIELKQQGSGTRLELFHDFAEPAVRDTHVQGWRYQLSLFANLVANEVHARASELVDGWFSAWGETNDQARERQLANVAGASVRFADRFSAVNGLPDLVAHIGAYQKFMAGAHLERRGDVRHCQGMLLVDWTSIGPDGKDTFNGVNVFLLGANSRIESVTGFWNPTGEKRNQ